MRNRYPSDLIDEQRFVLRPLIPPAKPSGRSRQVDLREGCDTLPDACSRQHDCPPVRFRLGSGEGFRLPSGGLILDGDASDKQEPDVLLLISEQPLA